MRDDAEIERAIEGEFLIQEGVPFHQIDAEVAEGVVTLEGRVHNILARDRAIQIAESVRGVRSVVDYLEVLPELRADADIQQDVMAALLNDPAADSYELQAKVEAGTVTLTGTVDSWQERQLSELVAKGVRGVISVDNRIKVSSEVERPDSEIRAEIERRLAWDIHVDDALINVTVDDGEVELSGIVGSAAEKRRAWSNAWTAGVVAVDDGELEVESWARDDRYRADSEPLPADDNIEDAVKDALFYDPRVLSYKPEVDVRGGVVTLSGMVGDLRAKNAAEQDARNTVGVWRVRNYLRVQPAEEHRDDEQITEDVRQALERNPHTDRYEMSVSTHGGEVSLHGMVDTYYEKFLAGDVVATVKGVVHVDNNLKVEEDRLAYFGPGHGYPYTPYTWDIVAFENAIPSLDDLEIREEIESQLFWSPFVDGNEITVEVEDGVAILTGTVDSWSERRTAETNAFEGGAEQVINRLEVETTSAG